MGKLINVYVLLLLLSDLFGQWACAGKEGYSDLQLQETVRMRCTKCHPAYYYEEKRHTRLVWELVILRMQLINGAKLKRGERGIISAYMARVRPASLGQTSIELFTMISPILLILAFVLRYLKRAKALK